MSARSNASARSRRTAVPDQKADNGARSPAIVEALLPVAEQLRKTEQRVTCPKQGIVDW